MATNHKWNCEHCTIDKDERRRLFALVWVCHHPFYPFHEISTYFAVILFLRYIFVVLHFIWCYPVVFYWSRVKIKQKTSIECLEMTLTSTKPVLWKVGKYASNETNKKWNDGYTKMILTHYTIQKIKLVPIEEASRCSSVIWFKHRILTTPSSSIQFIIIILVLLAVVAAKKCFSFSMVLDYCHCV